MTTGCCRVCAGFSSTISQVLVRFNTTPCAVTFSNATVVMCTTSAAKSGYGAYPAYITPSQVQASWTLGGLLGYNDSFIVAAAYCFVVYVPGYGDFTRWNRQPLYSVNEHWLLAKDQ